jgi:DNA-binding NarL/FixJ family response regulator
LRLALADVAQGGATVAILADDLIWATRLADAVRAAGGQPKRVRRVSDLEAALGGRPSREPSADGGPNAASFVIVDLTARAYDGVDAIRAAAATGARIVAVGQHDDIATRKAALAAGAERVYAYRKLFEDGPRTLGAWLGT